MIDLQQITDVLRIAPTDALIEELVSRRSLIDRTLAGAPEDPDPAVMAAVRAVAGAWDLHPTRVFMRTRQQPIAEARQAAMVLLRQAGFPYPAIGTAFRLDHGTAMHAVRTHPDRMRDPKFAARFRAAHNQSGPWTP